MSSLNIEALRKYLLSQRLSDAEIRVAIILLDENSSKVIAEKLDLTEDTVGSHRSAIFNKMNVHSRGEFISKIYEHFNLNPPKA
jgi:DNA-binding CsgD family transcriptional regulator